MNLNKIIKNFACALGKRKAAAYPTSHKCETLPERNYSLTFGKNQNLR